MFSDKKMPPDCTLTTSCFNLEEFHSNSRPLKECINNMKPLLAVPCYLVIFTDEKCYPLIKEIRNKDELTHYIVCDFKELYYYKKYIEMIKSNREKYWPTRDDRTCSESHLLCCCKFSFVLETIELNPFNTTKFGWIDSNVRENFLKICEDYEENTLIDVISNVSDKFHLQILNVCDKKYKSMTNDVKKEYYQKYRWVVCGCLFTTSKRGIPILNRLNEIFEETTKLGYGHGEEMFYLEVLDEFYDEIERGYGDYGQILNNFIHPTRNIDYILYIIQQYLNYGYDKECRDCCIKILSSNKANKNNKIPYIRGLFEKIKPHYNVIINIFGCTTIEKYKNEIIKINETWGKKAEKILFFLGEEETELKGDKYFYLKNVKNDYASSSYKQNLGLKYIYENYNADFVFTCGTDTFINIDNMTNYISKFDKNENLYIGGHGDIRVVKGENIYFHSGGAGFILTNTALSLIYPYLHDMSEKWALISPPELINACDVSISYFLSKTNTTVVKNTNFYNCNHKGYCYNNTFKCCEPPILEDIISCHNMTSEDFEEYQHILDQVLPK